MKKDELISIDDAVREMQNIEEKLKGLKSDNPMILAANKIDKLSLFFYDNNSIWDEDDLYFMNKSVHKLRRQVALGSLGFGSFVYLLQSSKKIQSFNIGKYKKYAFLSVIGAIWGFAFSVPAVAYSFRVNAYLKLKYVPRFENYVRPEQEGEVVSKSES
jgi:hypothetical protein